ncbi:hypothetical protein C8F01DRAFT_1082494 [Mycena amicta]|nr:hypothetical protein C8F01DRAFT_1082494 [Mycena amicta]
MSAADNTGKNPARVAAGLKATLARDNVSDGAKLNAQERLNEMGYTDDLAASSDDVADSDGQSREQDMHDVRVQAGYKAALKNPNVSAEAKQTARQHLQED